MKKRVTVYPNAGKGVAQVFLVGKTWDVFLQRLSDAFGQDITRIFTPEGARVQSVSVLQNNDILYATHGEMVRLEETAVRVDRGVVRGLPGDWVRLNVGGTVFCTTRATLTVKGGNFLSKMFEGEWCSATDETGAFLIDRTPEYFAPLLNYLRCGALHLDRNINVNGVLEEARFFGLDLLVPELERLARAADPDDPCFTRKELAAALLHSERRSQLRARGLNFANANLSGLDLSGIVFSRANFSNANMRDCILDKCNLAEADMRGADLTGASLRGTILTGANLESACMRGVNLSVLDDQRTNLESANLKNTTLEDAMMSGGTFRCCSFKDANLANVDLGRSDCAGANFEGANLRGACLSRANLNGANMVNCTFDQKTGL